MTLAIVLVLSLSACSSKAPPPGPCPRALILADADSLLRFREGPGRDLIDVDFSARISNVASECEYKIDKKTQAGSMTVQVIPAFTLERGPANRTRKATMSYFVTLTNEKREPVAKSEFALAPEFPANVTRQIVGDTVELKVPIQSGQSGRNFTIYVGFQLSEADLEYNRRLRREREGLR